MFTLTNGFFGLFGAGDVVVNGQVAEDVTFLVKNWAVCSGDIDQTAIFCFINDFASDRIL
jgi:hypothetical protein